MSPQLAAFFAAHKTAILGGGAAAVAGLAYLRRKQGAAAVPARVTAGATVPGTIPAAAVLGPTAGYDSTSFDQYNALQPELEQILQAEQQRQTTGTGVTAAPAPVASNLFAPSGSGQYVRYGSSIAEVESDGSLFAPTYDQWLALHSGGANYTQVSGKDADLPKYYTTATNLAAKNPTS